MPLATHPTHSVNSLLYPFRSGKNSKFAYFLREALADAIPAAFYRHRLLFLLETVQHHPDRDDILARAEYYCKIPGCGRDVVPSSPLPPRAEHFRLDQQPYPRKGQTYYYDSRSLLRYFPPALETTLIAGDVTRIPPHPALVKSRPIEPDASNANAVLLPLNKVRHFLFVRDSTPFSAKRTQAIFRGKVHDNPKRRALFTALFSHPLCDLGDTSHCSENPPEWTTPKMPIQEQLHAQFIFAIEGNDVASNLKWVLSSNSLALMPRPQYETWFMEGTLIPETHYVEIAPDASDAPEKIAWYAAHPNAAEKILHNAHQFVARFRDPTREKLTGIATLARYFDFP